MTSKDHMSRRTVLKSATALGAFGGTVALVQGSEVQEYEVGNIGVINHTIEYAITNADDNSTVQYSDEISEGIPKYSIQANRDSLLLGTTSPDVLPQNKDIVLYNDMIFPHDSVSVEGEYLPITGNEPGTTQEYMKVDESISLPSPTIATDPMKATLGYSDREVSIDAGDQREIKLQKEVVTHTRTEEQLEIRPIIDLWYEPNMTIYGDKKDLLFPIDTDDPHLQRIVNELVDEDPSSVRSSMSTSERFLMMGPRKR